MMYVCLWTPAWSTGGESAAEGSAADAAEASGVGRGAPAPGLEVSSALAELAPRIRVEAEVVWADARGLDARALAERLLGRMAELGVERGRAGVAAMPIAAELAARWGPRLERDRDAPTPFLVKDRTGWGWRKGGAESEPSPTPHAPRPAGSGDGEEVVVVVPDGAERRWVAGLPVAALGPPDRLRTLLDGVGIARVGDLAALEREPVEVALGADAVELWRRARCDDRRVLFRRVPPQRPHGSIDFVEYVLTDPARLLFTANALLGPLCDRLVARGEHARAMRLTLPLADGSEWRRTLRPARPTASRDAWLRLLRGLLERLTVSDAVAGMMIEVGATEAAGVRQGDLFDRGFATAAAVEAAVARLLERQPDVLVRPARTAHPLLERRAVWETTSRSGPGSPDPAGKPNGAGPGLTLQLLPEPRSVAVETGPRRDHTAPTRFRDRSAWREVVTAAGPDRISGGQWEAEPFAREYYRCVTPDGSMVWLFRDARDGKWYLHGWWD